MVGLRRHWFGPGSLVARFRFRVHVPARQHLDEIDCLHLAGLPRVFRQTDLAMAPILLGSAFDQLANLVTFRPDADHVPDHETAIRHPPELEPDGVIGLCAGRRREIPVPDPFGPRLDIDGLDEFSFEPRALEHASLPRHGPLLVLTGDRIFRHRRRAPFELLERELLRPQCFAFLPIILPKLAGTDAIEVGAQRMGMILLEPRRQTKVPPRMRAPFRVADVAQIGAELLGDDIAGQIARVRALHDHNDRAWPFRVEPVWQLLRPEADDLFALHAALDFQYVMRIVIDDDVATPAGDRGHRAGEAIAAFVVLETRLLVLIRRQREAVAPVLLIPWRFDQAPAFGAVARGQLLPIGDVQELYPRPEPALLVAQRAVCILAGMVCPHPRPEEHM